MALVRIQLRRDSAEAWASANPVLDDGEPGFELDTGKVKVGDGVRNWQQLPYAADPAAVLRPTVALASSPAPAVGTAVVGVSEKAAREDHSHALPSKITSGSLSLTGDGSVGGTLTVVGSLVGGSHKHGTADINGLSAAVDSRIGAVLKAGTNIALTADSAGVITIANTQQVVAGVTSFNGLSGAIQIGVASLPDFPAQSGNAGKVLATTGTGLTWQSAADAVTSVNGKVGAVTLSATSLPDFPSQSGNSGKFLTTSGSALSWATSPNAVASVAGRTGAVTLTSKDLSDFPSQTGSSGKFLTTNGTTLAWALQAQSISSVAGRTGVVTLASTDLVDFPTQVGNANKVLSTNGTTMSWVAQVGTVSSVAGRNGSVVLTTSDLTNFPSATGNAGKYLTNNGSSLSWADVDAGVTSVNGKTGAVTLTTSNLSDFQEAVQDAVAGFLKGGANVSLFYDDSANTLTVSSTGGGTTATGVSSVNGKTGNVVLEIPTASTIDSRVASVLTAGTAIVLAPQADGKIKISVDATQLGGGWTGAPTYQPLRFTVEPQNTVDVGGIASFTVATSGGVSPYTYQWQRKLFNDADWSLLSDSGTAIAGTTTTTLRLAGLGPQQHLSQYRCVSKSSVDAAVSNPATLETIALKITDNPDPYDSARSGQATPPETFSVSATAGGSPIGYQWQSAAEPAAGAAPTWSNIAGATESFYGSITVTLGALETSRVILYRCSVTSDGATLFSNPAPLTVTADRIAITTQPASGNVNASGVRVLTFAYSGASGTPEPTIGWQCATTEGSAWTNIGTTSPIKGVAMTRNGTQLTVTVTGYSSSAGLDERTLLSLVAMRFRGVVTQRGQTVVTNAAQVYVPGPVITLHPAQTESVLGVAEFSCNFDVPDIPGLSSAATVQWYRRAAGATSGTAITGALDTVLQLSRLTTANNNDTYYAIVAAQGRTRQTYAAKLIVRDVPFWLTQPSSVLRVELKKRFVQISASTRVAASIVWQTLDPGKAETSADWYDVPQAFLAYGTNAGNGITLTTIPAAWEGRMFRAKATESSTGQILYSQAVQLDVVFRTEHCAGVIAYPPQTIRSARATLADMAHGAGTIFAIPNANSAHTTIYRSTDNGDSWQAVTLPRSAVWRAIQYIPSLQQWVAVAPAQTTPYAPANVAQAVAVSSNGTSWSSVTVSVPIWGNCQISHNGSVFVLAHSGGIATGNALANLTARVTENYNGMNRRICLAVSGQRMVAVGTTGSRHYSTNGGTTWTALPRILIGSLPARNRNEPASGLGYVGTEVWPNPVSVYFPWEYAYAGVECGGAFVVAARVLARNSNTTYAYEEEYDLVAYCRVTELGPQWSVLNRAHSFYTSPESDPTTQRLYDANVGSVAGIVADGTSLYGMADTITWGYPRPNTTTGKGRYDSVTPFSATASAVLEGGGVRWSSLGASNDHDPITTHPPVRVWGIGGPAASSASPNNNAGLLPISNNRSMVLTDTYLIGCVNQAGNASSGSWRFIRTGLPG